MGPRWPTCKITVACTCPCSIELRPFCNSFCVLDGPGRKHRHRHRRREREVDDASIIVIMAQKRLRGDEVADLSTLAVFTYQGKLSTHYIPAAKRGEHLPALIEAVFGSNRGTFSFTASTDGVFLVMDESMHRELFGGADSRQWSCLYSTCAILDLSGPCFLLLPWMR